MNERTLHRSHCRTVYLTLIFPIGLQYRRLRAMPRELRILRGQCKWQMSADDGHGYWANRRRTIDREGQPRAQLDEARKSRGSKLSLTQIWIVNIEALTNSFRSLLPVAPHWHRFPDRRNYSLKQRQTFCSTCDWLSLVSIIVSSLILNKLSTFKIEFPVLPDHVPYD